MQTDDNEIRHMTQLTDEQIERLNLYSSAFSFEHPTSDGKTRTRGIRKSNRAAKEARQ